MLSSQTLALGNVHGSLLLGTSTSPVSGTVTVTNTAIAGGETLTGGVATPSDGLFAAGSLSLAPGQSGTVAAYLSPLVLGGADGSFTGTLPLTLASTATDRLDSPLSVTPITVTAAVYSYADPIAATSFDFGSVRNGGTVTGTFAITKGTVGDVR